VSARAVVAGLALLLATAGPAAAQPRVHRFLVDSVADSTFVFRVGQRGDWLRAGATGVAVDPARRDALVARFRVVSVSETRATALVTGQTTLVTRDHVALVEEPPTRFFRSGGFWGGTVLGAILGAAAALLLSK
jgi:hypothetical protein